MKIQLDFDNKTIVIIDRVDLNDLMLELTKLEKAIPDFMSWELIATPAPVYPWSWYDPYKNQLINNTENPHLDLSDKDLNKWDKNEVFVGGHETTGVPWDFNQLSTTTSGVVFISDSDTYYLKSSLIKGE